MFSPHEVDGRRAMAPPNVTVVQGIPPFGPHPAASASMLSYLYQSGLYNNHHHPNHSGPPHPYADGPPSLSLGPPAFLHPGSFGGEFPFPGAAAAGLPDLTSAGLVAAAAAAAGLHLNPAALMLSAAGQLAAHPWLYPGYLAAAAALGQTAAALHPPAADSSSGHRPNSPSSSSSGFIRHGSRFAPYSTAGRHGGGRTNRSPPPRSAAPVPACGAASPPAAPDTTDSPSAKSPSPPESPRGGSSRRDVVASGGELRNIEQMVNGLDKAMKSKRVSDGDCDTDVVGDSDDRDDMMDVVDSSKS